MILKASQRSHGTQLTAHLLNERDNDLVDIHEVSGFLSNDVAGAFAEIEAVSKGTRCQQPLFSMSLSPPPNERASVKDFEEAANRAEETLKLQGQPRVMVFHEKDGRRHAHCVWSRIDTQQMKAINMAHYKHKLTELSRELYLDHGWRMPNGLIDRSQRNPLNFSLEEWQQAKRLGQSPKAIKAALKESWANNPTAKGFTQALERQGYYLAKGDRRGYVAVDWQGEVYSLTRWLNVKTNVLKTKLGERDQLPSVKDTTQRIHAKLTDSVHKHLANLKQQYQPRIDRLTQERKRLAKQHQAERAEQKQRQQQRWEQDSQRRQQRFAKGMKGLWHRFTGKHRDTIQRNEQEALAALQRDQQERDELIFAQLQERQAVQCEITQINQQQQADTQQFKDQLYRQINETQQHSVKDAFDQVDQRHQERQQTQDRGFGLER